MRKIYEKPKTPAILMLQEFLILLITVPKY